MFQIWVRSDQWLLIYSNFQGSRFGSWLAIIVPLGSPSCKLRLTRISDRLKFQDGPSVATIHGANKNNELINSVISSEENEGKKTSEEAVQVVKSSTIEVLSFYTVSIFYFTYPRFVCFAINL